MSDHILNYTVYKRRTPGYDLRFWETFSWKGEQPSVEKFDQALADSIQRRINVDLIGDLTARDEIVTGGFVVTCAPFASGRQLVTYRVERRGDRYLAFRYEGEKITELVLPVPARPTGSGPKAEISARIATDLIGLMNWMWESYGSLPSAVEDGAPYIVSVRTALQALGYDVGFDGERSHPYFLS